MVATLSGSCLSSPAHHGGGLHETRLARVKAQDKRPTGRRDPLLDALGFPHPGIQLLQEYAEPSCSLLVKQANRLFVVTGLV